jgi:hypothetical protein
MGVDYQSYRALTQNQTPTGNYQPDESHDSIIFVPGDSKYSGRSSRLTRSWTRSLDTFAQYQLPMGLAQHDRTVSLKYSHCTGQKISSEVPVTWLMMVPSSSFKLS